jgi:hypothetical protein
MSSPLSASFEHSANVVHLVPPVDASMICGAKLVGSSVLAEMAARAVRTVAS